MAIDPITAVDSSTLVPIITPLPTATVEAANAAQVAATEANIATNVQSTEA